MDYPRQLMPKQRRRSDHPGMVAAAKCFQISTASESGMDADHDLPLTGGGDRNPFNPDVFFAVEHGSVHLTYHALPILAQTALTCFGFRSFESGGKPKEQPLEAKTPEYFT